MFPEVQTRLTKVPDGIFPLVISETLASLDPAALLLKATFLEQFHRA